LGARYALVVLPRFPTKLVHAPSTLT
jgi:hypothetical protein